MLLELGKFGSLLVSILSLAALFHTAFLMPASFEERSLACLELFALSAGACWLSGWMFCRWERQAGVRHGGVITSFPMKLFWWTSGMIGLLFAGSWYLETYFVPWKAVLRW